MTCACNKFTVALTDAMAASILPCLTFNIDGVSNPRAQIKHWDNDNTQCWVTEPTTGSVSNLAVYSDALCTTLHPDLEVVVHDTSTQWFYV